MLLILIVGLLEGPVVQFPSEPTLIEPVLQQRPERVTPVHMTPEWPSGFL